MKENSANAAANNPGLNPPNHALSMTAHRNNKAGAPTSCSSIHCSIAIAPPTNTIATAYRNITGGFGHQPRTDFVMRSRSLAWREGRRHFTSFVWGGHAPHRDRPLLLTAGRIAVRQRLHETDERILLSVCQP